MDWNVGEEMSEEDFKELDLLYTIYNKGYLNKAGQERMTQLYKLTEKEQEHPEWYDQACLCYECICAGM